MNCLIRQSYIGHPYCTQHNDTQHKDIQFDNKKHDTEHKNAVRHYAECRA